MRNQGIIPDNFDDCQWHYVDDDIHIFGVTKGRIVVDKYAIVKRLDDGSFDWAVSHTRFQGNEPSKSLAQERVGEIFYSAINIKR